MTPETDLDERKHLHERTRDQLLAVEKSSSESYDRALLTLSSAFLGGSLAFTDSVVELDSATSKWMLYVAWLFFALTIVLTLSSFVFSLFSMEKLREGARKYYLERDNSAWNISKKFHDSVLKFSVACGISFVIGIVLLATFIFTNLAKEAPVPKEVQNSEILERSIPPATFQKPVEGPQPSKPAQAPAAVPQGPAQQTPQK